MQIDPNTLQEDLTLLVPPAEPMVQSATSEHAQALADYTPVLIGILGVLVIGWLALRWRRFASRAKRGEAPHVIALRELLKWQSTLSEVEYREAVAAVSGTVRRYVEGRFGLHAPMLTTEEFWAEQRVHRRIPEFYDPFWSEFLETCDPIKYAGLEPQTQQLEHLLEASIGFVKASSGKRRMAA